MEMKFQRDLKKYKDYEDIVNNPRYNQVIIQYRKVSEQLVECTKMLEDCCGDAISDEIANL